MLNELQMKALKQVNVSKNTDKTKERIKACFAAATREQKNNIVKLTGQKRNSVYRVFNTGMPNARIVLAMAQILDISPYYLIGEEDEKATCGRETVLHFLEELGYKKLIAELKAEAPKPKRRKSKKAEVVEPVEEEVVEAVEEPVEDDDTVYVVELSLPDSKEIQDAVAELGEDDAALLLVALLKRAKASETAAQLADVVKRCLLA